MAKRVSNAANHSVYEMGDEVRAQAISCGFTDPTLFAAHVFQKKDKLAFAKSLVKKLMRNSDPQIIVGPRTPQELEFIEDRLSPITSVAVYCDDTVRYQRWLCSDKYEGRDPSELWRVRNDLETQWHISKTISECDIKIDASGSIDSTFHVLSEALNRI